MKTRFFRERSSPAQPPPVSSNHRDGRRLSLIHTGNPDCIDQIAGWN